MRDRVLSLVASGGKISPKPFNGDSIAPRHQRSQSTALAPSVPDDTTPKLPPSAEFIRAQHVRSFSVPHNTEHSHSPIDTPLGRDSRSQDTPPRGRASPPQLPPLNLLSPVDLAGGGPRRESSQSSGGGWWEVVSAVDSVQTAPWNESPSKAHRRRSSSVGVSAPRGLQLPPGAEPAQLSFFPPPTEGLGRMKLNEVQDDVDDSISSSPEDETPFARDHIYAFPSPPIPLPQSDIIRTPPTESPALERWPKENRTTPFPPSNRPNPAWESQNAPDTYSFVSRSSPRSDPVTAPSPAELPRRSEPSRASGLTPPIASKSKLSGFGRSVSLASRNMMGRGREKDKEGDRTSSRKKEEKDRVMNDPGKWNRDMVSNIMGPPADRR
jgi:hypothetical protein